MHFRIMPFRFWPLTKGFVTYYNFFKEIMPTHFSPILFISFKLKQILEFLFFYRQKLSEHYSWSVVRRQIVSPKSTSKICQKFSVVITNTWVSFCLQDKTWIKMPKWTIFFNISKIVWSEYWDFLIIFLMQ